MNPQEPEELTDSSKYIRTYAKDLAAMAGKANAAQPAPAPQPQPVPEQKTQTSDGVTLPTVDESLITQSQMKREQQAVDLSDAATSGEASVFEQRVPDTGPTAVPLTPAGMPETRDSILERLKAKAGSRTDTPAVPPLPDNLVPVGQQKQPEPLVVPETPPQPVMQPEPAAPPPPPPPPRPTPPPPQPEARPFAIPMDQTPGIPPLTRRAPAAMPPAPQPVPERAAMYHGYSTDLANRIDREQASTFTVMAAQADSGPRQVVRSRDTSRPAPKPTVIIATLLIILGISGLGLATYIVMNSDTDIVIGPTVPSLIAADEFKELEGITGAELMRDLRDVSYEPLVSGNVLVTYVTTASTTAKDSIIKVPQQGGTLIKALPLLAPDILTRNIRPESTVGVIHAGSETRPFFILKVSSFERTFAGMLAWEQTMRGSLQQIFPPYPNAAVPEPIVDATATTTASTTPVVVPAAPSAPTSFVDAVVRNHDVRVLRDAQGRSLMLYGYKDKETLIIARDEAAFLELVNRLNQAGE